MREKEIVIRVRLPGWPKMRWLLSIAAACVCLGAVSYAALPHRFAKGEPLSSKNLNDDLDNLDTRLTKRERPVLFCHHVDQLPPNSKNQTSTFTAADCGGTAPDASYVGALVSFVGCNGIANITIAPGPKGLWYIPLGDVPAACLLPGETTTPYTIEAVFIPK